MTIVEAIDIMLKQLGGRGQTGVICKGAAKMLSLSGETPENSVRAELYRHPQLFRRSPNKPTGWWESVSFQEEMADVKAQVEEWKSKYFAEKKELDERKEYSMAEKDFIEGFNLLGTLSERLSARKTLNNMYPTSKAWRSACAQMQEAGYFSEKEPKLIIGHFYEAGSTHTDYSKHIEIDSQSEAKKLLGNE